MKIFMAQEKQRKVKTFYLYNYSNELVRRTMKIYSPYNVKTLWRTPSEDYYANPDFVEFKDWQYTVDPSRLSPEIYDQQIEWLGLYNARWWQLSKWWEWQKHLNWRFYKNNWINVVRAEEIKTWPVVKKEVVKEVVEVQQIPELVVQNMNVGQLKELATAWDIELPENMTWDAWKIKDQILWLFKEWGHIS